MPKRPERTRDEELARLIRQQKYDMASRRVWPPSIGHAVENPGLIADPRARDVEAFVDAWDFARRVEASSAR